MCMCLLAYSIAILLIPCVLLVTDLTFENCAASYLHGSISRHEAESTPSPARRPLVLLLATLEPCVALCFSSSSFYKPTLTHLAHTHTRARAHTHTHTHTHTHSLSLSLPLVTMHVVYRNKCCCAWTCGGSGQSSRWKSLMRWAASSSTALR